MVVPTKRRCVAISLLTLLLGCVATALSMIGATKSEAIRFVFPRDRSVLSGNEVTLICVLTQVDLGERAALPKLLINGSAHSWDESFAPPKLVAHVKFSRGLNRIKVDGAELSVYVKGDDAKGVPQGWKELHFHPPTAKGQLQCASCHAVEKQSNRVVIGDALVPSACDKCHSELEFELKHHHPKQPMEQCTMCHSVHASDIKGLLKEPSKQLCARCHD